MFDHNNLILFGGDLSCARVRSSTGTKNGNIYI